jgi:hypothetical protein
MILLPAYLGMAATTRLEYGQRGALVRRTTNIVQPTATTPIPWQVADYDTDGFWSPSDPTKFIIPPGVRKITVSGIVKMINTSDSIIIRTRRNAGLFWPGSSPVILHAGSGFGNTKTMSTYSGVANVTPGEFFDLATRSDSGGRTVVADETWFCIQVVE